MLAYVDDDGSERTIEYASKAFTETQRNWSITEREGFAVVWALQKWQRYLTGRPVTCITDHSALLFLKYNAFKCGTGKIQRWLLAIDNFDVTFVHRAGESLTDADSLTRMYKFEDDYISLGSEDSARDTHYEALAQVLPKRIHTVREILFPDGCRGRRTFKKHGRESEVRGF